MDIAEAARGICELMWLVDLSIPENAQMARLLKRWGPVVDMGGRQHEEIVREVRAHAPDGIVTYFDAWMGELAALAADLGLPFFSEPTASALVDKVRQRDMLCAAGIETPRYVIIRGGACAEDLSQAADAVSWPAVLKPRSESGSHHTFFVRDIGEVQALLAGLGPGHEEMILEEYLSDDPCWSQSPFADYVSVETAVAHGHANHIAITGRFPPAEMFRETGFFTPAALDDIQRETALALASRSVAALGVETGVLHIEIKFTADGPRIIEVNGRAGGGIPDLLMQAAHFSLLATTLRIALGEDLRIGEPLTCERVGYRFFLQPPPVIATIKSVDGVTEFANRPGVDAVSMHLGPGSHIDWRDGTRIFVLAAVGSVGDYRELQAVAHEFADQIHVSYELDRAAAGGVRAG
jgi:biotin carboxylase